MMLWVTFHATSQWMSCLTHRSDSPSLPVSDVAKFRDGKGGSWNFQPQTPAQPQPQHNLQQLQHGVGGIVNSRREGGEAASAEFRGILFEQAWTPTPGVWQEQAKELFEVLLLFFRKSEKTTEAWIAGNIALTSFRRSSIFLHKAVRNFLAEAQRLIFAGVKGTVIPWSPHKKSSSFMCHMQCKILFFVLNILPDLKVTTR